VCKGDDDDDLLLIVQEYVDRAQGCSRLKKTPSLIKDMISPIPDANPSNSLREITHPLDSPRNVLTRASESFGIDFFGNLHDGSANY